VRETLWDDRPYLHGEKKKKGREGKGGRLGDEK